MTVYVKISEEDINELVDVAAAVGVEVNHLRAKIERLEAINAELVKALKALSHAVQYTLGHGSVELVRHELLNADVAVYRAKAEAES